MNSVIDNKDKLRGRTASQFADDLPTRTSLLPTILLFEEDERQREALAADGVRVGDGSFHFDALSSFEHPIDASFSQGNARLRLAARAAKPSQSLGRPVSDANPPFDRHGRCAGRLVHGKNGYMARSSTGLIQAILLFALVMGACKWGPGVLRRLDVAGIGLGWTDKNLKPQRKMSPNGKVPSQQTRKERSGSRFQ